jgi:hypothetical protein
MRRAILLFALPACTYVTNTYVIADDAGAGSTATGGVGGALVDAGPDVVDAGDAACEPRECYATDPATCERWPLTGPGWACDGGICADGGCVPGKCTKGGMACFQPPEDAAAAVVDLDAGEDAAAAWWVSWNCEPGAPSPSPYCIGDGKGRCCPPEI